MLSPNHNFEMLTTILSRNLIFFIHPSCGIIGILLSVSLGTSLLIHAKQRVISFHMLLSNPKFTFWKVGTRMRIKKQIKQSFISIDMYDQGFFVFT